MSSIALDPTKLDRPGEPVLINCQKCDDVRFVIIWSPLLEQFHAQCFKCGTVQS